MTAFRHILTANLKYDADGLIPAIVQDINTKQVLMVAWMNDQAVQASVVTGEAFFWSRSRQELWHKGETSGNIQRIVEMRVDCDADTLLLLVEPAGPACHTGEISCFYDTVYDFVYTRTEAGRKIAEYRDRQEKDKLEDD